MVPAKRSVSGDDGFFRLPASRFNLARPDGQGLQGGAVAGNQLVRGIVRSKCSVHPDFNFNCAAGAHAMVWSPHPIGRVWGELKRAAHIRRGILSSCDAGDVRYGFTRRPRERITLRYGCINL